MYSPLLYNIGMETKEYRMLIKMKHGLGDNVQLTCVLRHLKHYYPTLNIGVEAKAGTHSLYEDLADDVYLLGQNNKKHLANYEKIYTLPFRHVQSGNTVGDFPHTKVWQSLHDHWPEIKPIEEFFHYQIPIKNKAKEKVDEFLNNIPKPYMIIHSRGTASRLDKDLLDYEEATLAEIYLNDGLSVIVLDWRSESAILDWEGVYCPGVGHDLWAGAVKQGGCAQIIAELGRRADTCIGIDSGPGHVWGGIDTPTYIFWSKKHPIHCYDLADNVIHVVPDDVEKFAYSKKAHQYFLDHYKHVYYDDNLADILDLVLEDDCLMDESTLSAKPKACLGESNWNSFF
jgi:ADP-heptose:LPS heptosyltransferase